MSLSARDLGFGYRGHPVGRAAAFQLAAGEVVALLGPNGGGKTTLLKTLIGLLAPQAGEVLIDDRDLAGVPVTERARRIGYVPQASHPAFAFTAFEVVLMGRTAHMGLFARPSRHDRAVATAALERLGIAALGERPVTALSGGERQLVLIARALAQEPAHVVLDEPTASLDFGNQGKVMRQIRGLAAEGLGVVFTTHDPNQAAAFADRVVMLKAGTVIAEGPAARVVTRPQLEALYGAPVATVTDEAGRTAFLPG